MNSRFLTTKIPLEILAIKEDGYHCFADVLINNDIQARMILDTGASRTVMDLKFIQQSSMINEIESNEEKVTGLGTNSMQGFTLNLSSLKIGELVLKNYLIGILDLQHVNETYRMLNMPEIQGAIGSDILFLYDATISFGEKILSMSKRRRKK